jgi:hypothetical protein
MTAVAWGAKVSRAFVRKVVAITEEIGIPANWLMAWMAFETGETFSPSKRNVGTGVASGLIQFMPATARDLGTTTSALALMTAEEQLDYVRAYFKPWRGKLHSIDDGYMVILWPKAVGKPDDFVLFDKKSKATRRAYLENAGLDADHDGVVTKREAAAKVRAKLQKGMRPEYFGEGIDAAEEDAAAQVVGDAVVEEPGAPQPVDLDDAAIAASAAARMRAAMGAEARAQDSATIESDIAKAAAAAARERPPGEPDNATVLYVQHRLLSLNYFTVGEPDEDYSGYTRGAIVKFKHEHGLSPETPDIDAAFLAALRDPACAPAKVSERRAATTVDDLRAGGSETITFTDRIKKTAMAAAAFFGFRGVTEGGDVAEQISTGTQLFGTIKHSFNAIGLTPTAMLWIGGTAVVVWYLGNKIENHRVNQARTGEHL